MLQCRVCKQTKEARNFRFRKNRAKHETQCRACERDYQNQWYRANSATGRERVNLYRTKFTDPWEWQAKTLRRKTNFLVTVEWLKLVWKDQKGRCALTGRNLDIKTAELDRIVGNRSSDLNNLRLVAPEAKAAKNGMTDAKFVALCQDVVAYAAFGGSTLYSHTSKVDEPTS